MKRAIFVVVLAVVAAACASTKTEIQTEQELRTKEFAAPIFAAVEIPDLPEVELPPYPAPLPADATEEEKKARAVAVASVKEIRATIRASRIKARELQIEKHNEFARDHPFPTPTPTPARGKNG